MKNKRKIISLGLAASVFTGAAAYAAPTHIVVDDKAYKITELANGNYRDAMMADIEDGGSIYIADDEGKTISLLDITTDYDSDLQTAPNKANDVVGPVKEVKPDLTEGDVITLPGSESTEELAVESISAINNTSVTVTFNQPIEGEVSAADFTFDNGLTVTDAVKSVTGESVTLTTTSQTAGTTYTLSYKGEATDKNFVGADVVVKNFEITSAESRSNTEVTVVLADAPLTNLLASDFTVSPNLEITSVTTNNNVVTLKTSPQTAGTTYTLTTATGTGTATFEGKAAVAQTGAISNVEVLNLRQIKVSFSKPMTAATASQKSTYYLQMVDEVTGALSTNRLDQAAVSGANWDINLDGQGATVNYVIIESDEGSVLGETLANNGIAANGSDVVYNRNLTLEARGLVDADGYTHNSQGAFTVVDANAPRVTTVTQTAEVNKLYKDTNSGADYNVADAYTLAQDKAYLEVKFSEPVVDNTVTNTNLAAGNQVNNSFKVYIDGVEVKNAASASQKATVVDPTDVALDAKTVAQDQSVEAQKTVLIDATDLTRGEHTIKIVGATDLNGNVMAPNPYQGTFTVSDEVLTPPPASQDVKPAVTEIKQVADNALEIYFDQDSVEIGAGVNPAVTIEKAHFDGTNWVDMVSNNTGISIANKVDLTTDVVAASDEFKVDYETYVDSDGVTKTKWIVLFRADDATGTAGNLEEFHYDGQQAVVRNVVVQNYVAADNVSTNAYYNGSTYRASQVFEKDITAPTAQNVKADIDAGKLYVEFNDNQFDGDIAEGLAAAGPIKVSRTSNTGVTSDEFYVLDDNGADTAVKVADTTDVTAADTNGITIEAGKTLVIDLNDTQDTTAGITSASDADGDGNNDLIRESVYTVHFNQGSVVDAEEDLAGVLKGGAGYAADYIMVDANKPNEMVATSKSVSVPKAGDIVIQPTEGLVPQTTKGLIQSGVDVAADPTATTVAGAIGTPGTQAYMGDDANLNKILVVFDGEVLESSALNKNNYKFNGAALPQGSEVAFYTGDVNGAVSIANADDAATTTVDESADDNFVLITLPEGSVQKDGLYTVAVSGITNKSGKMMLPVSDSVSLVDNTKPVASTVSVVGSKQVKVTFDELIAFNAANPNSAADSVNNFRVTVNGVELAVNTVTADADGKSVILTLSQDFTVAGAKVQVQTKKDGNGNIHIEDTATPANDIAETIVKNY